MILRQSTQIVVRIGPFMDATDGVTPETGVTLGAADQAEVLKAAGAATTDISAATWAAVTGADGWYDLTLTTSHTDTVGTMRVVVQDASVCLPVFASFQVIEEAVYDAIYAASAAGYQVPIWSSAGATVNLSATTIKTATDVETDTADIQSRLPAALTAGGNIKADAVAINAVATTSVTNVYAHVGTSAASTAQTGDSYARIGANGASLSAIPWNASWDAEVQSEVQDALEANQLDHFIQVADPGSIVANDSLLAKLVSKSATAAFSSYVNTTDSLEAIRDRGDAAWTTATGFSTLDAAGVRTAVGLASANLDTQLDALPTGAENATAVWGKTLETGFDATRIFRIIAAATAGKVTGEPGSPVFRDLQDTTDMITGTADADGNRSAATYGS